MSETVKEFAAIPETLDNIGEDIESAGHIFYAYEAELNKLRDQNRPTDGPQATLYLERAVSGEGLGKLHQAVAGLHAVVSLLGEEVAQMRKRTAV